MQIRRWNNKGFYKKICVWHVADARNIPNKYIFQRSYAMKMKIGNGPLLGEVCESGIKTKSKSAGSFFSRLAKCYNSQV